MPVALDSAPEALLFSALRRHVPPTATLSVQHPVGPFRVDIAVVLGPRKLAVEVDGRAHHTGDAAQRRDAARTRYLELDGWKVVRVWAAEVSRDLDGAARRVADLFRGMPRGGRAR